jgi:glutathione S-transferase
MKLLGTTTSPYTRKILILARAAGLGLDLVDIRTPEGLAQLEAIAPLGKIPVVLTGGPGGAPEALPDSGLITRWLWAHHEEELRAAGFDLDPARWEDGARLAVIEGAMDATINRFYLRRDGLEDQGYVAKQRDRVRTSLGWLDGRMTFQRPAGVDVVSLGCFLDWALFREQIDLAPFPGLARFRRDWLASGIGAGSEPG